MVWQREKARKRPSSIHAILLLTALLCADGEPEIMGISAKLNPATLVEEIPR